MRKLPWKKLQTTDSDGDHPACFALSCFFYLSPDIHDTAPELAIILNNYLEFVGIDTLKSYASASGDWKDLTSRQINKDLKLLQKFPKDHVGFWLEYDSSEGGEPGHFGITLQAYEPDEDFDNQTSIVRCDFPASWFEAEAREEVIEFFSEMTQLPQVQYAYADFVMKTTSGSESDAEEGIQVLLKKYMGLNICDHDLYEIMRDKTFSPSWLTYLDDDMADEIGGVSVLKKALSGEAFKKLKKGVLLRAARLPPLGDRNRKAPDIGCLPGIARLLKPTRLDIEETYLSSDEPEFNSTEWIERFDKLDDKPWDNSNVG